MQTGEFMADHALLLTGFVRTDQIERFKDANGNLIDPGK